MRQEVLIVAGGEVGALVGAARLLAAQGRPDHGLGHVQHEGQLQGGDQLGVEGAAVVVERHAAEALLELAEVVGPPGQRLALLREEMQKTMEVSAGIYRSGDSLARAADTLRGLQERSGDLAIEDHSRTFNTERIAVLEFSFMLDVAEAIVHSALRRQESRGAHQRTDFPARDDQRFLAHSLIYRNPDGSCRVDYVPVTITRWPPAERVYGR